MTRVWIGLLRAGVLLALFGAVSLYGGDPLTEARAVLETWVQTRQLIARTRTEWQADRDVLEQTVALYERELKGIDEALSKVSTNQTQAVRERDEAETLKRVSAEALDAAKVFAGGLEFALRQTVPQLPAPLQDLVRKDLARLPADPANTRMTAAERIQVTVAVLNEIDKFNNAVNVFSEKRANAKGEEVAVQTLYVGLGAAFFVNDTADFAGVGAPGKDGWHWTVQSELAPTVLEALKVYRNEHSARFLKLPVTIQ
jgi:hypothetical protein